MTHGAKVVTENTLRQVFERFGEVVDVVIKKLVTNQKAKAITGYGFIHYAMTVEGLNAAKYASWSMRETTVDNIIYRCTVSHGLQQIMNHENPAILLANHNHKETSNVSSLSTSPSTSGRSSPVSMPVIQNKFCLDGLFGTPNSSFYEKKHENFLPVSAMDFSPSNSFFSSESNPFQTNSSAPMSPSSSSYASSPEYQLHHQQQPKINNNNLLVAAHNNWLNSNNNNNQTISSHSNNNTLDDIIGNNNNNHHLSSNVDLFTNFDALSAEMAMNLIA
jgi:hypothetical protein